MCRKAEWHHHLVAAVDTGLTAAHTRRLICFWTEFSAVDQFSGAGLLVAGDAGDLLRRDAACGTGHEGVPELAGYPLVPQACGPGDLAELATDVVLVQHRADHRGEHQAGVLPQLPGLQAVDRLGGFA